MMKNRDLIGSLFWIGVGVIFCIGAVKYGLMRSGIPGPGFFPFLAGIILISLSLVVLISAIDVEKKKNETIAREAFFSQKGSWRKVLFTLVSLFGYGIAFEYLGFLLTTFLLMIFLLRFIEPQRWIIVFIAALLTVASSYVIFELCLDTHFPKGILGI
jgi:putative tricarboxylic transport membrane protein